MEELYQMIESKIKASGYLGAINGLEIYTELSDLIEEKDQGTYILMSKRENDDLFEYKVDIREDDFNLSYINITKDGKTYHINFDN